MSIRTIPWLVAACATLGGCAAASLPSARGGTISLAGTYEVSICRGPCASAGDALVQGHLVLEDSAYAFAGLPEPAQSYLAAKVPVLVEVTAGHRPNACFVLRRAQDLRGIPYAGLDPVGVTRWSRSSPDSVVTVALWRSWDAGYGTRLSVVGRDLRGEGRSWDATLPEVRNTVDVVTGRRVGPPDRGICTGAAEQLATTQP